MSRSKYIIVDLQGIETPILFPSWMNHADMAENCKVVSAGEFEVGGDTDREVQVWAGGKSVSLKTFSRGEKDGDLIKRMITGR